MIDRFITHRRSNATTRDRHARRPLIRRAFGTLLAITCGVSIIAGCGGWWGTRDSVRFNFAMTEREMSRLPPLSAYTDAEEVNYESEEYDYEAARAEGERRTAEINGAWHRAAAEADGDFDETRRRLSEYLDATERTDDLGWGSDVPSTEVIQANRNAARDRLDALASLDDGASASAVTAYLVARAAYDKAVIAVENEAKIARTSPQLLPPTTDRAGHAFDSPEAALTPDGVRALETAERERRLADNCLYLRAALRYRAGAYTEAATLFDTIERKYPRSEKLDAARFMAGLSWMKASGSYNGYSAVGTDACPECQNEAWTRARDAFLRLTRGHSRNRFAPDARGWLAYLFLRVGRTGEGLTEYYRLLAAEEDQEARAKTLLSLSMIRPRATPADMEQVERLLADEPRAALVYLYHSIYNHTFHTLFSYDDEYSYLARMGRNNSSYNYNDNQRLVAQHRDSLQRAELERIARYASELMRRHPRTILEGDFALRLAEINLELGEHAAALNFADRALRLGVADDFRAEALWVKGIAENRLTKLDAARRTLHRLVAEYPQHHLAKDARRHLAVAAEDAGDLKAALEQYFALDYRQDIAYFLDVLMTPDELRSFIEQHTRHERIDELWYALGVRYMRAGFWSQAREAYTHVRTTREYDYDGGYYSIARYDNDGNRIKPNPKETSHFDSTKGVDPYWVLTDLKTIDVLQHYEQAANAALDPEARAEALYQKASYLYEGGTLLFYNPALWNGMRYESLNFIHAENRYRAPDEAALLWHYAQRHEPAAQALDIYLHIVAQYPQTRAARDALYTAAVCHERLSDYNNYWRSMYDKRLHAGSRMVTYADVRATYPRYQLPRATLG